MPGQVIKQGNQWITTWGSKRFKHKTKAQAEAQLRALYASESQGKRK